MTKVVLVHGGFAPINTGAWFWTETGVTSGLAARGVDALVPDRRAQPATWREEADHLAALLGQGGQGGAVVVGASNGCSAATRLALDHPAIVAALVLCWPATAGDPEVDAVGRAAIGSLGLTDEHIDLLFDGDTLRGVRDDELVALACPVVIIPSDPFNPHHQERTVVALAAAIPGAELGEPSPEPPMSYFPPRRDAFLDELVSHLDRLG